MPVPCLTQDFIEPWQQYQHPLVRQLAFAVGSPNILSQVPDELELEHAFDLHPDQMWQQHLENYHPRLLELDQNPQALENFVAQLKSTRLGLRFEMLIWFWLLDKGYHPYTLLGHSIQKIDGPKTLAPTRQGGQWISPLLEALQQVLVHCIHTACHRWSM